MGLFNFKKKPENEAAWKVYQDKLGDKLLSVRVNTKYAHDLYSHTYYVQIKYCQNETNELPSKEFLQEVAQIEDKLLKVIEKVFEDNIAYLGSATFGGSSYLTFASNLDVKWKDFIESQFENTVEAGCYMNDNMGYYNQVLYPDFIR